MRDKAIRAESPAARTALENLNESVIVGNASHGRLLIFTVTEERATGEYFRSHLPHKGAWGSLGVMMGACS